MNAFDRVLGGAAVNGPIEIGLTEILGERAIAVAEVDQPAKYLEGKYTVQDRIDLGFAQNPMVILPGTVGNFTAQCSSPFKPEEFIIDSSVATDVSVMNIDIGSSRYIEGGPVPGAVYSEVANTRRVSWRTVQTNVPIQVGIRNDALLPVSVKLATRGLRLV